MPMPERKVLVLLDRDEVQIARRACVDVSVLPGLKDAIVEDLDRVAIALRSALDEEATEREEWRRVSIAKPWVIAYLASNRGERLAGWRYQSRTTITLEDGAEYRSAWRDLEGEDG